MSARQDGWRGGGQVGSGKIGATVTDDLYITDEMRAAVGREYGRRSSYPIDPSDIRRWAIAVYYPEPPPPLFWDADYAATTIHGGIVAPEDFNPFAWSTPPSATGQPEVEAPPQEPGYAVGPEASVGVASPKLRFQLNGGTETEYTGVRMRPGDVIRSTTSIAGYRETDGRFGRMLLTTTESRWVNHDDEVVKVTRGTLIRY